MIKNNKINLVTVKSGICFEINLAVADLAGLKISSKLLKMVKIIKTDD